MATSIATQQSQYFQTGTTVSLSTASRGLSKEWEVLADPTTSKPYDLTGLTIEFRVSGPGGPIAGEDNKITDAPGGRFTSTWPEQLYYNSMDRFDAVFLLKNADGAVIDTTSTFHIHIDPTPGIVEVVGKPSLDAVQSSLDYLADEVQSAQNLGSDAKTQVAAEVAKQKQAVDQAATDGKSKITASVQSVDDVAAKAKAAIDAAATGATDKSIAIITDADLAAWVTQEAGE